MDVKIRKTEIGAAAMLEKTSGTHRKKLIVHCGTAKTGTTHVQKFLRKNQNVLASHGFYYPPMEGILSYQHLSIVKSVATPFFDEIGFPEGVPAIDISEMKSQIAEKMEKNNCDKLLLSSEFFWCCPLAQTKVAANYKHLELVSEFFRILKETFSEYDFSFVVWLRRQDSFENSMINQYIKEGRHMPAPQRYMKTEKPWLKYYENLQILSEIFGREEIVAKIYSRTDTTHEFLEFLGLDAAEGFSNVVAARRQNISIGARLFHVLRHVNKVGDDDLRKEMLALPQHVRIFDDSSHYRPYGQELYDDILQLYKEDNRNLARDWFQLDKDTPFDDDNVNGDEPQGVPQKWTHKEVAQILEDVIRWKRGD